MGKIATKMPNFCLNKIRPLVRVRSSSPIQSKNQESSIPVTDEEKRDDNFAGGNVKRDDHSDVGSEKKVAAISRRKVMIVVDSSVEAKNAVQWALGHTVQNHDIVILLYVIKPSKQDDQSSNTKDVNPKIPEFLTCMKNSCQLKRPEVNIDVVVVEGKDKGPAIVEAARKQEAALLVVGQKKRSVTWRLMLMWAGNQAAPAGGVAEYCVQNASCMAIAVRKKSNKLGGYVITTKRQKDFWLLA